MATKVFKEVAYSNISEFIYGSSKSPVRAKNGMMIRNNFVQHTLYEVIRIGEESGIPSVAVKCVEIRRNTSGEGGFLDCN